MPDMFSIFILPPSMGALRQRLEGRGQDSPETITHRLDMAHEEIRRHGDFDALLTNEDFAEAYDGLKRLLLGEPLTAAEQAHTERTLQTLLAADNATA